MRSLCCKDKKHVPRPKWQTAAVLMSLPTSGRGHRDPNREKVSLLQNIQLIFVRHQLFPSICRNDLLTSQCFVWSHYLMNMSQHPATCSCTHLHHVEAMRGRLLARFFSLSYSSGFLEKWTFSGRFTYKTLKKLSNQEMFKKVVATLQAFFVSVFPSSVALASGCQWVIVCK